MLIKPMKCIVIEDFDDSRRLIETYIRKTKMLELIGSYSSALEAINDEESSNQADLVLLDIELPDINGLEYLQTLKSKPAVIILSGLEKYAIQAFEYDVSDYLLKPIIFSRFYKAISKVYNRWRKEQNISQEASFSFIRKGDSLVRISLSEISYIEAMENYVVLFTESGKHLVHFTMKALMERLPEGMFIRTHRSYVANINKIESVEANSIKVKIGNNLSEIPIGRVYRQQLLERLNPLSD
ncbi:MAG: LytTR family DNA-binding domain-containing protein [Bacteroidales bacterium]|nr:LytTR family DNA-binding domain-containing protein [Bacteroidales bacterium]